MDEEYAKFFRIVEQQRAEVAKLKAEVEGLKKLVAKIVGTFDRHQHTIMPGANQTWSPIEPIKE